jgi:hypothetical protein
MEAEFSVPLQTAPDAHPISCTVDTGAFSQRERGRGVALSTTDLYLAPMLKKG